MFVLLDPKRCRDELMTSFERCLIERKHYYLVIYGMGDISSDSMILSEEEARKIALSVNYWRYDIWIYTDHSITFYQKKIG